MKLLDTTVAVDHLRGDRRANELLRRVIDEGEVLAASEVVRFELAAGVRDDEMSALDRFYAAIAWIPVGEDVARTAGRLARDHRRAYSGIDDVDYLIAATAMLVEAALLTTNVRHFPMLAGLRPAY